MQPAPKVSQPEQTNGGGQPPFSEQEHEHLVCLALGIAGVSRSSDTFSDAELCRLRFLRRLREQGHLPS